MTLKTFAPKGDATVPIAGTTASASATLDQHSNVVRVVNAGPDIAFIRFGKGATTAVVTDMPILSGATETFTKGDNTTAAAITASGTAALYFTNGEGL